MKYEETAMAKLSSHFADLCDGRIQIPNKKIYSDIKNEIIDIEIKISIDHMIEMMGPLFSHFVASVPYILEELARVIASIIRFKANFPELKFSYYELDAFDGTVARTIGRLTNGEICTLTSSPNPKNYESYSRTEAKNSSFFHGPYFEVTNSKINEIDTSENYKGGFDFIYEMAAFQFYDKERSAQITHAKTLLKSDGILILLEKLNMSDPQEYEERESVKDLQYKTRYFTQEEIAWKKETMLDQMEHGQVTEQELVLSLKSKFKYVFKIWNSTNFYEFIASDNEDRIELFISILGQQNIPTAFCFDAGIPLSY